MSYVDDNFGEFVGKTFTKIERGRSSEGNDAFHPRFLQEILQSGFHHSTVQAVRFLSLQW